MTNVGHDRSQLSRMAEQAKSALNAETLDVVADRGYYSGEEIVACEVRAYPSVCRSLQRQTQRPMADLTNKISSMSRRTMFIAVPPATIDISIYARRGRQKSAPLLDFELSGLFAEAQMHSKPATTHLPMGARGRS